MLILLNRLVTNNENSSTKEKKVRFSLVMQCSKKTNKYLEHNVYPLYYFIYNCKQNNYSIENHAGQADLIRSRVYLKNVVDIFFFLNNINY